MAHVAGDDPHDECLHLPRAAVRFPVEWRAPEGFRPDDKATWPRVEGRLEYFEGRIRYLPPCGGMQQDVATDVTALLHAWVRSHPEFVVGSNEAGMIIGEDVRGADAAVWRRAEAGQPSGFRRSAPLLAVEVAGQDEDEAELREKAAWYLGAGVHVVRVVLPASREVVVVTRQGDSRHQKGDNLPEHASLPGLSPPASECFFQLDRTSK